MNSYTFDVLSHLEEERFVTLNKERLQAVAVMLVKEEFCLPSWRDAVFPEDDRQFVEFIGVANTINFCFFARLDKRYDVEYPTGSGRIWHGSMAMAAALKRALDEEIPILNPDFLYRKLTARDMLHIFRSETTEMPLLSMRAVYLQGYGRALSENHLGFFPNKKFYDIFQGADFFAFNHHGVPGIVDRLVDLPRIFRDRSLYRGYELPFNKRAMLVALVYYGRAASSGGNLTPLKDPHGLGPIADCQVPKILHHLGILHYNKELSDMIDSRELIRHGGDEELEIRIKTVRAMSLLLLNINYLRREEITMAELDYKLWSLGRSATGLQHHRTITTAY